MSKLEQKSVSQLQALLGLLFPLALAIISFLLILTGLSCVSSSPHPGRIGRVRFVEVEKLTNEDLGQMVPHGAEVFFKNKTVQLSYVCVKSLESRKNTFQCGKYVPAQKLASFDEDGREQVYHNLTGVKVVIAEPGTLGWVFYNATKQPISNSLITLTDSWFDCEGNLFPKKGKRTPCRGRWEDSLIPGYCHENDGLLLVTWAGKYHEVTEIEYLKHTTLGATIHQAVENKWMRLDHPPE